MECLVQYKTNLRYYKYLDAWKNFEEIFEQLDIDNFDMSAYYQPVAMGGYNMNNYDSTQNEFYGSGGSGNSRIRAESTNSNLMEDIKNGSTVSKKTSKNYFSLMRKSSGVEIIKERKVLIENVNKNPSSKEKDKIILSSLNTPSNNPKSAVTSGVNSNYNLPHFELVGDKLDQSMADGDLGLRRMKTTTHKKNSFDVMDKYSVSVNSCGDPIETTPNPKNKSSQNLIHVNTYCNSDNLIDNKIDNKKKIILLKQLISFDNLKYLKNLRVDIKDIIEKFHNQELNSKLNESLKPNIFNELFENLLSKFFQNFYKNINTNPKFTSRLENILLYYYKSKNKLTSNYFLDLEKIYHIQSTQHKVSSSMNDMKLSNDEKMNMTNYNTVSCPGDEGGNK